MAMLLQVLVVEGKIILKNNYLFFINFFTMISNQKQERNKDKDLNGVSSSQIIAAHLMMNCHQKDLMSVLGIQQ